MPCNVNEVCRKIQAKLYLCMPINIFETANRMICTEQNNYWGFDKIAGHTFIQISVLKVSLLL